MDEKVLKVGIKLYHIYMIWIGYLIVRASFPPKRTPEIPHIVRAGGIISLSIGCLPNYFISYISLLVIFAIVWASYLDSKKIKSPQLSKPLIKLRFSLFTWDMWIVTIVCLFLTVYYVISIFI